VSPRPAAHAELLKRAGDTPRAARAYKQAIALSSNARRAGRARKASERAAL